jgi:hypothetical protein
MANQFLVEIHQYLKDKIADNCRRKNEAEIQNAIDQAHYYSGQLQELQLLRNFVIRNFNLTTYKY